MPVPKNASRLKSSGSDELDPRIVRSLSHPIRHRILAALNERVASPKELAAEMGEPLGNVSYHTRVLAQLGCIELVRTTQRRGALEHHYRAVMRPYFDDAAWASIPVSTRRALFDQVLDRLWTDVVDAARSGGLDHPRAHVSWTTLDLDEEGVRDLAETLAGTLERALEIQAEAAGRRIKLGDEAGPEVRTELGVLFFERAGAPASRKAATSRKSPATRKRKTSRQA
jgi:DNA-binding transcriptional ArsR family regulator